MRPPVLESDPIRPATIRNIEETRGSCHGTETRFHQPFVSARHNVKFGGTGSFADIHSGDELQGNLAAMLKAAQAQNSSNGMLAPLVRWEDERSPDTDDLVQIMLVAGGGFEPPTFGL